MEPEKDDPGRMEAQLKHWGAKLDELVARAEESGADAKAEYRKRLEVLRAKHQNAQSKLAELRAAGGERWENFKTGMESVWKEIEVVVNEVRP